MDIPVGHVCKSGGSCLSQILLYELNKSCPGENSLHVVESIDPALLSRSIHWDRLMRAVERTRQPVSVRVGMFVANPSILAAPWGTRTVFLPFHLRSQQPQRCQSSQGLHMAT